MDTKNLLVEILLEELPARPFLKEFSNIEYKWHEAAHKYNLKSSPQVFFTPRRIVIFDKTFPLKSSQRLEEYFGPPIALAYFDYDTSKTLSKAGESFCLKCQIMPSELKSIIKDGKEVLYYSRIKEGTDSKEILAKLIKDFIISLQFGKSMRWGNLQESFIRPIRNICILLENKHIPIFAYGIQGKATTKVHRDKGFLWMKISNVSQYFQTLQDGCVILSQDLRKEKILLDIANIEKEKNVQVEVDPKLLEEVVAITEYPRALYGEFEEKFLELPQEVIITSMKGNQRYFATFKNDRLHYGFILVSNSSTDDTRAIILGNQRVLKARLSDAMFFYQNDLNRGFESEKLSEVGFVEGLGSMKNKTDRERKIALFLVQKYQDDICNELGADIVSIKTLLEETFEIAKADLMSEMVGEFPELQGLMGYYYAKLQNRDKSVCNAIKEQYFPDGEDSLLPSSLFSSIVAMAGKLDSIFALFASGKLPTGSKDPFALRRSSSGIIKIILDKKFDFDLDKDIAKLFKIGEYELLLKDSSVVGTQIVQNIQNFFVERLDGFLVGINPSILSSVLASKEYDICSIIAKVIALNDFFEHSDKEAFISTFKRVANITKDMQNDTIDIAIDKNILKLPQEIALFEAYEAILNKKFISITEAIRELFSLKFPLDNFFDKVMVNDNDEKIRQNRKSLIFGIYQQFLNVGDIKEIAF